MPMTTDKLDRVESQARDWFLLQQERSLTADENTMFMHWLALDQQHQRSYQQVEDLWRGIAEIQLEPQWLSRSSTQQGFVSRFLANCRASIQPFLPMPVFASASVFTVMLFSLVWLSGVIPSAEKTHDFYSEVAQVKKITLEDGSLLTMGADSHIQVTMLNERRLVRLLKGQAFFDVAKDQSRPFFVDAEKAGVMVVGTRFEVYKQYDKVKVSVEEGVVKVAPKIGADFTSNAVKTLTAGQKISSDSKLMSVVEMIDVEAVSPWRDGRLVYRDAALSDVVFDINRYRKMKIILGTESLKKMKVTTSLSVEQTDSMISMLEQSLPVVAHQETQDRILILPKNTIM
jgi:transmembrane sensor